MRIILFGVIFVREGGGLGIIIDIFLGDVLFVEVVVICRDFCEVGEEVEVYFVRWGREMSKN